MYLPQVKLNLSIFNLVQKYDRLSHPVLCALFFENTFFIFFFLWIKFFVSALQPLAIGDPTEVHCPRECVSECVRKRCQGHCVFE